jgi:hypothetical protein
MSDTAFWALNAALVIVLCMFVLLAAGHRLNGEPCGHPPASARGSQGDESDCGIHDAGDPDWCC